MIVVFISVALFVSLSQTLLYAANTPSGTIYPLVHNFAQDYYQYLDIIRQGYDGWWTATSRLTPEVYPRMVVSVFLLFLGHVARIFHLWVPLVYTIARVSGGIALMILVYRLIKKVFPQSFFQRLIALVFTLFGTYWWGWGASGPTVAPLTHAWTELDPIFRWSFVPHHLWSKVGMVAVFLFLLKRHTLYAILLTVLLGFINPVIYVTLLPTVGVWFFMEVWHDNKVLRWTLVLAAAAPVLLYHRYLQMNIFPWTSYYLWEQTLQYTVKPWEYAVSLGPTLPLFLLAIPGLWRMGSIGKLLIAWVGSSWVMMYIAGPFVPVTIERYLGGYQFIPLSIGAAVFFKVTPRSTARCDLMKCALIVILFSYFSVGLYASLKEHAGYVEANRSNLQVYIPADLMATLAYLEKNGVAEDVVMAPYEIGSMIPGLTGKRVIAGHTMFTKDVGIKRSAINEFFSARDATVVKQLRLTYNIRWVLADAAWIPPEGSGLNKQFSNATRALYIFE